KTHRINTKYKTNKTTCISITDKINLSTLTKTFLSLNTADNIQTVYLNISIHSPFEELNRILFSLFLCGTLTDLSSGLTFSLLKNKRFKFIIEVPYMEKLQMSVKQNFDYLLPVLSIVCQNQLEEVTNENYQLFIGDSEELVARFLK
ncbi:unnamed protein product, partial [Didymodactylos carnosus]